MRRAGRGLALALAVGALAVAPAGATWSIVAVDRATGEVAVASATCLAFPLDRWVPVVVVGRGGAAAQSVLDIKSQNRIFIRDSFLAGLAPARILDLLGQGDPDFQQRQYGIVSFDGPPVTFTGTQAGEAKHGVAGQVGDLAYAIQGNVLAGDVVVTAAEQALVATPGDLSQKVMAAMEAARALGGDGRCSCGAPPDGCGAPPPGFTHSAWTAFVVLARPGDADGGCDSFGGCISGDYYLLESFVGGPNDPPPVPELQKLYDAWRLSKVGVPDHVQSTVIVDRQQVVADGRSTAWVRVRLRDLEGTPLTHGGARVVLARLTQGAPTALAGEALDRGDGSYDVPLTATTVPGRGRWAVRVLDPASGETVQLHPPLVLETAPLAELHVGHYRFSAQADAALSFTLNRGPADAGRPYRILGTFSGTAPGFDLGGVHVPLNRDRLFQLTWTAGGGPPFRGSVGALDVDGRAAARLALAPAAWGALVGERLHFGALLTGAQPAITNLVNVEVEP